MASAAPLKTTFIGDIMLLKYQNSVLKIPSTIMHCQQTKKQIVHCGFTIRNQRLSTVKWNLDMIAANGNAIHQKVVILLGAFDVVLQRDGPYTYKSMQSNLNELIACLWERNVEEIILCTIPYIPRITDAQNDTLNDYNEYIKILGNNGSTHGIIRSVDLQAKLLPFVTFESDSILPNDLGLQKIHDALKGFL